MSNWETFFPFLSLMAHIPSFSGKLAMLWLPQTKGWGSSPYIMQTSLVSSLGALRHRRASRYYTGLEESFRSFYRKIPHSSDTGRESFFSCSESNLVPSLHHQLSATEKTQQSEMFCFTNWSLPQTFTFGAQHGDYFEELLLCFPTSILIWGVTSNLNGMEAVSSLLEAKFAHSKHIK